MEKWQVNSMKYSFSETIVKANNKLSYKIGLDSIDEISKLEEDLLWYFEDLKSLAA